VVVAECLGKLAQLHPSLVLPVLVARCQEAATSGEVRCTLVGAVKHAIVDRPHPVDAALQVLGSCVHLPHACDHAAVSDFLCSPKGPMGDSPFSGDQGTSQVLP
jgi:hypothetical protein